MPRYKVTIGLLKHTLGPTESYITPAVSQSAVTATVQSLLDARNNCLYDNVSWVGVRIAQLPEVPSSGKSRRRSVFYPPGMFRPFVAEQVLRVPSQGNAVTDDDTARPDQTRACVITRVTYDTDRRASRYMAFVPDASTEDEPAPLRRTRQAAWWGKFDTFANFLVEKQFAVIARNKGEGFEPLVIRNWVQSATSPANVGVVVDSLPNPNVKASDYVLISDTRRKGTDRTSYNGRYVVQDINTTLLPSSVIIYLRGTETGDPSSVKLLGKVQKLGWAYYPIEKYEAIKVGTHKRGNGLGRQRGRVQRRVSLDP